MRKSKSRGNRKTKIASKKALRRIENPAWLQEEPEGKAPGPPVRTRAGLLLPFGELTWENFERLCLRVSERGAKVEAAWSYGKSGHTQHGIDILIRLPDSTYHAWQSKRYKSIRNSDVKASVDYFIKRKWGREASHFVLAVGCEFSSPKVIDAIEEARISLQAEHITFEALDARQLTDRLRNEPELVDDFFGRPWAEAVCRPEALAKLVQRLSRFDVADLRGKLRSCYTSWISTVDPGLPIISQDRQGRTRATVAMTDRYIQPDLIFEVSEAAGPISSRTLQFAADAERRDAAESGRRQYRAAGHEEPHRRALLAERRIGFDEYLCSRTQSLILGDAGSGKSSLLRFLALDILSDRPILKVTKERYRGTLPVWLPFALWMRMSEDRRGPVSIEDVIAEFFRAQGEPGVAEDMRRAIASGGHIILLVDGLDEASDSNAAQTLVAILTAFIERKNIPIVATSRPHGARNLAGLGGSWSRSSLAPLSDDQRHALATLWFRILEAFEAEPGATNPQIAARARRRADGFISALQGNSGITRLSQTPLFLLSLINLHSRGQNLPRSRFAASREIVAQLMEHQPRRREVSALSSFHSSAGEPRLRDRVIADFAFALQSEELRGPIPDAAAIDDAIARSALLIGQRQGASEGTAEVGARAIFSFTEERAGLLVNKAPGHIGFLHLSLQEYLSARHLMQFSLQEKLSFVSANATSLRWREPILYLLSMTTNEIETGQLVQAIENAPAHDVTAQAIHDALLTDAVFADFSHDLNIVRRIAAKCFSELELTAWGSRQRDLLGAAVDGLFSESIGHFCRMKLAEWTPDRHGYDRSGAIRAILTWDAPLKSKAIPALFRCLRSENESVWREAAQSLPIIAERSLETKRELLRLARKPPSVETAQAAIFSIGLGWTKDEDVGAVADALRASDHSGLCLDAIRIRARRGEANDADLNRYLGIAFSRDQFFNSIVAPDLAEYFAKHHRELFSERLEAAIAGIKGDNIGRMIPLVGSLFLCDPNSVVAERELLQILSHDWALYQIFSRGDFPIQRITWTAQLVARIEAHLEGKERHSDHELYWISKAMPLPTLKQRFMEELRRPQHLSFWASRALVEVWGKDDSDVRNLFASLLDAGPEALSEVGEELPLVIEDRTACRAALLRGLRSAKRCDFLLRGCKNLGITADDEEVVRAALEAGTRKMAPVYRDMWASSIIDTFGAHPDVRMIATTELMRRDGALSAVARSYFSDPEMCDLVLGVLCPLDEGTRMNLVRNLESASPSNDAAFELLGMARQDTDGLVCGECIIGWVEAALARGAVSDTEVDWLENELDTVGPEYEKRRTAAVVGLLLTGNIERFVKAKRYDGKELDVSANPDLTKDDLYLRRLLARWPELTQAMGSESEILERFNITPERTLQAIHSGVPNADRLFALLMKKVPDDRHLDNIALIVALAEHAPRGNAMRDLLTSLLTKQYPARTAGNYWASLRAGEIFAEYFRSDQEMRSRVLSAFNANAKNAAAAGALAEVLLREDDPVLGEMLAQKVRGLRYDVGTHFKLMAALAPCEDFIASVVQIFRDGLDIDNWSLPYWTPALVRRVKTDPELQEKILAALADASNPSHKVTLLALLSRGMGRSDKLALYAKDELRRLDEQLTPAIGFDLSGNGFRPVFQVLTELTQ